VRPHLVLVVLAVLVLAVPTLAAERPMYYSRPVTTADLEGRTLRELSLMRNTIFARAGNIFRKSWLHEYFTAQPWYRPTGLDEKTLSALDRQNAAAIAKYELALPRAELKRRKTALEAKVPKDDSGEDLSFSTLPAEEFLELTLLAQTLGEEAPDYMYEAANPNGVRTTIVEADMLDNVLTVNALKDLSKRDLRILRNTVYARRGRVFKTETMRDYFSRMEWYHPDPKYTDARLTATDLRNIKLIRSVEDSLGGPQSEAEAQRDPFVEA
jgi:YARHG domain